VPRRRDLTSRRERSIAAALRRVLRGYERAKDRLLVDVPHPDADAFYDAGDGVEALPPGALIDSRPIEVRLFRRRLRCEAWHLKFRTTTSDGSPTTAVATLLLPRRRHPRPSLLAYQPAIDSLGPAGDPSFTLRRGDHLELPVMLLALRRGWTVLAVDWTGPQHSFVDLTLAARHVLDRIRAALAFDRSGLDADAPVALWGYSGGALATLFAAERHPHYAPELNIVGAAAGGGGVDITSSPEMFEVGNLLSGIPFGACIAASRTFPDFALEAHLTAHGHEMVAAAADMTMEQLALSFPFVRMSRILTVPSISELPGARAAFEATRCGQATPETAMFLYHAVHDQATEISDVDKLVERYRAAGVEVAYRRYRVGEHLIVMFRAVRAVLRFLGERADLRRSADR